MKQKIFRARNGWAAGIMMALLPSVGFAEGSAEDPGRDRLAGEVARLGWIVYSARTDAGDWDLFACRPDGSSLRNLTRTREYSEGYPVLAPDGKRMLYRRIGRGETFDGNVYGSQGQAVVSGTDGTGARALGGAGQFPWACWSADAARLVCLSTQGIEVFDSATMERMQVLDRMGFFQQITVSPDADCLVGVANGFGTRWSVGVYDLASGRTNAVSVGDSCTPNWSPSGDTIVFSHKPPGQKANGGYGWTQLWAGTPEGSSRRLLYAEEGRHLYGGHVSPDGRFVVFTGNHQEDGDAGRRGSRMSIIRLADAPIIVGDCPETRWLQRKASDGPVLHLPDGWEPWWTASELSPPPAALDLDPVARTPATAEPAEPAPSIEVTARLLEIPEGAVREDPLYRYAAVLKYEIVQIHRGAVADKVIFIAHYRPQLPRAKAADPFRADVHGSLTAFREGGVHRMVLVPNAEKLFIGGVVNNYLEAGDIYWARRTDSVQGQQPNAGSQMGGEQEK